MEKPKINKNISVLLCSSFLALYDFNDFVFPYQIHLGNLLAQLLPLYLIHRGYSFVARSWKKYKRNSKGVIESSLAMELQYLNSFKF